MAPEAPGNEVDVENLIKMLDWAEQQALENLRSHLDAMASLKKETVTALSILFAAAAACVAYVSQHFDGRVLSAMTFGVLLTGAWLYLVCAGVTYFCLQIKDAPVPTNHGRALIHPNFPLHKVKRQEIANIDQRSDEARQRVERDSYWLNRLRVAALFAPLAFVIGYWAGPTRSFSSVPVAAQRAPAARIEARGLAHPRQVPTDTLRNGHKD